MQHSDKILVLDFGSQYTQLIARRIREMQVLTEIVPGNFSFEKISAAQPKGIILSGGPGSAKGFENYQNVKSLFTMPVPILGICFGMQLMNTLHGGSVQSSEQREYGKQKISVSGQSPLFQALNAEQEVWMSHGDHVETLAPEFISLAKSQKGIVAAFEHKTKPHYGVLFHPEVTHTENGEQLLRNFIQLCQCEQSWNVQNQIELIQQKIQNQVKDKKVISLVSGGVDSTVATVLCCKALGPDKVIPLYIDTGLMRERETENVKKLLEEFGLKHLIIANARESFLEALKGVSDSEKKRKIIGEHFITVLEKEIGQQNAKDMFLCQGTLYTDLIESGLGCGTSAHVIKSHHNVNPPIIEAKRRQGLIVEPNDTMFKDEVRQVGEALGIPHPMLWRHPFPGPGLAIRIIGEVTEERLAALRKADRIFLEEIEKAGLYDQIWQAFAVLVPVSTVGVMGDQRTTGHVIALRAVNSVDGMTADFYPFPYEVLGRVATRIVNEVSTVNRVVYDVTSKPPGTIEWE